MDLTNLSLDELLAQIKADSGYTDDTIPSKKPLQESVPPKKSNLDEFVVEMQPEDNDETEDLEVVDLIAEVDSMGIFEELEQTKSEEDAVRDSEDLINFEGVDTAPAAPVNQLTDFEAIEEPEHSKAPSDDVSDAYDPLLFLDVVEEDETDKKEESVFSVEPLAVIRAEEEMEFDEPVKVYTPAAPSPAAEPIEIIEDSEEETPSPFEPSAQEYIPAAPQQEKPLEIIEDDEDEQATIPYVPPLPNEAAKPEPGLKKFALFGNINIDSDVKSMFPKLSEEQPEQNEATEKNVVAGELPDKTVIFERPGIITGKNLFEKTADLRAVPAILSAEDMLKEKQLDTEKTFVRTGTIPIVAPAKPQPPRRDDGQMVLPGFDEPEEPVEYVDENVVEDELRKSRSKKVSSFRLEGVAPEEPRIDEDVAEELGSEIKERRKRFSSTKTRTRLNRQSVEYRKPSDRAKIGAFISRKRLTALIGTAVSGACALIILIITAIPSLASAINNTAADLSVTTVISLAMLAVAFFATLPVWSTGITCFFSGSGKPNAQTPVFLASAVTLIQSIILTIFDIHGEMPVFAPAAALVLCLSAAGSLLAYSRVEKNFAFLASKSKDGLYTVRTIENASDANRIGRNVVMGEADIRYSGKTKFATNFLAYSFASDAADDLCIKLVPITAAASIVIGLIAGFASKSVLCGMSIFAGAMCMGAPASAVLASNLPLSKANKALREDGGIITGYAGAFEYESTNAVAVDAADIFPGTSCNIHGMKTFYGVRIDDAILTAASMLIASEGPISSLFNEVVMGRKELLMNVEELVYEDRLGLSGWIRGRRVFVGNRKLLENHNIEIPMSVDEAKYRHDGRRVVYLADAGKIAAIFVVSYGSEPRIAEHLRRIENNGINILIRTTDSNITEEFVANTFGLPLNSVKIVSTNAGEVLKSYADGVTPRSDAKLLHNGSAAAFLHCVSKASSLCASAGIVTTQQTFCTAAGLLLMAIITIFSGALSVSALQICICQLVWAGIGAAVSLINRE